MFAILSGKKYLITWRHANFTTVSGGILFRMHTECYIYEILSDIEKRLLIQGKAECSNRDRFSKNTGRKLSLERALLTRVPPQIPTQGKEWGSVFTKEDRKTVWQEYFKMRGNKY